MLKPTGHQFWNQFMGRLWERFWYRSWNQLNDQPRYRLWEQFDIHPGLDELRDQLREDIQC